ncbi:MAG TPA: CHAD domain-containing protein [Kofleriaceae bacterium]|nr:CHAD domain-containing protein [Kofleriaceae bacterium]
MATTTTTDGSKTDVVPAFSEEDKLGPLGGGKRSLLDDEAELRRVLVVEFQAAADAARDAAGSVDENVTTAVHDFRKALRRARAVLSLTAAALPKSERRAINRALREARRALGTARDHAVAPDTVDVLPLGDGERDSASSIIRAAADSMPPVAEIKQLLAEGAARAAAQVEALEAALPQTVEWSTVEKGIRSTYRDARTARKSAKRNRRSFHAWRRRSKELGYQLELLAGYAGTRATELSREIESVTDTQGPAVDLVMLRDFVRTHAAGVESESVHRLVSSIEAQIDDLVADSRRAGREAFRKKPRRFARRLTKAVRRDLAPVVVPDDVD